MSDPTRGITCPDMRRVIREALASGWKWDGFTGSTHARIKWPKTGAVCVFGTTPSVASWKSLATDIQKHSGVTVWRKGNRKKSRKKAEVSGYRPGLSEQERLQCDRNEGLMRRHSRLLGEFDQIRALGRSAPREDVDRARMLLIEGLEIEQELTDNYQPLPERTFS